MSSRRLLWTWRALLLAFAAAYLASPSLQLGLPIWLPFLAAVLVEAQFFVAGARGRRGRIRPSDSGPQPRDLEELGWDDETDDTDEAVEPVSAPPRRRRVTGPPRLLSAVIVLALLGVALLVDQRNEHWQRLSASSRTATVALLDREASLIARHPAQVICDVAGRHVGYVQDADGLAEVGGRRAWLTPSICYQLYLVAHKQNADASSGHAIAVLAHEAWHLNGEANEGLANCFAYQAGVAVGEHLGLPAATARRLMAAQLRQNPIDFADAPAYVVPSGCRDGGPDDLQLDGPYFP